MGTRSTIKFYDSFDSPEKRTRKDGSPVLPIASIYQQYDGYLSGVGLELAEFLKSITVINGFGNEKMGTHANGMGCLAAQFIQKIKTSIGGVYMTTPDDNQEYNYEVWLVEGKLQIRVDGFVGSPEEFIMMVKDGENS